VSAGTSSTDRILSCCQAGFRLGPRASDLCSGRCGRRACYSHSRTTLSTMRPGFFPVGCPIEQLRNVGAEVLLSAQHPRDTLNSPWSLTHCLFVVSWSISQHSKRPQGIAPRLHRICPPGQVVLHLRHQKLPAPCAWGRRHGSRSVGWRFDRLVRGRALAHESFTPTLDDTTAAGLRRPHRLPPPHKGLLGSRNSCTVLSGRRHTHADCGLRRHGQE
jgi:hypothetical protein